MKKEYILYYVLLYKPSDGSLEEAPSSKKDSIYVDDSDNSDPKTIAETFFNHPHFVEALHSATEVVSIKVAASHGHQFGHVPSTTLREIERLLTEKIGGVKSIKIVK